MTWDAIVLGLGGMGSAAVAHLASRGRRVLGLEQFTPAHDRGSSHGNSRIIRQAYFEDPAYVPLLLRAYELWNDLELRVDEQLYLRTGGLMVGSMHSELVAGSLRSAREYGLAHELLDAGSIARRFPATAPRDNEVAVFETPAGMLFPEACIRAHLKWAQASGADLQFETNVTGWRGDEAGVEVTLANGQQERASHLVICAGAWLSQVVADLGVPLRVERNVVHWFAPSGDPRLFEPGQLPVYIVDRGERFMLYGFPSVSGSGIKAAFHHTDQYTTPQNLNREVSDDEVDALRQSLVHWLPRGAGKYLASSVCMYTLTPDLHFLVDTLPHRPNVVVAGGFSGHGFKFCSVMGEVLADIVTTGATKHPIGLFSLKRFTGQV